MRLTENIVIVLALLILILVITADGRSTRTVIREQAARTETHYLLPKDSACAVKTVYFRSDATTDLVPAVRTVCHWDHSR
jgi:hypothetical protein